MGAKWRMHPELVERVILVQAGPEAVQRRLKFLFESFRRSTQLRGGADFNKKIHNVLEHDTVGHSWSPGKRCVFREATIPVGHLLSSIAGLRTFKKQVRVVIP